MRHPSPPLATEILRAKVRLGFGDGATVTNIGGTWLRDDIVGTSAKPKDAGMDPNGLQNNGGPTQTIMILPNTNDYETGDLNGLGGTLDQRGLTRQSAPNGKLSRGAYDPDAS